MPRLSQTIEAERAPLAQARIRLCLAEADLNGIVAQLAAGRVPTGVYRPCDIVRKARTAVYEARHALDAARLAALDVEHLNGVPLCTNDPDDMGDALLHAIDRIETGTEPFDDPNEEHRLTAFDYGVRTGRAA